MRYDSVQLASADREQGECGSEPISEQANLLCSHMLVVVWCFTSASQTYCLCDTLCK